MGAEAKISRTWRAYFNTRTEAPLCWSIDDGSIETERKVRAFVIDGAIATTWTDHSRDNVREPRAWLAIEGTLQLNGDLAIFRP